jgi:hypothetical protein
METWNIGLSSWIIQDGNYADFQIGQQAEFALEFAGVRELRPSHSYQRAARHIQDCSYHVNAQISHLEEGRCLIDFGLLAYNTSGHPTGGSVGAFVEGGIWLGIDYYEYFELMSKQPDMPAMIYTWRIDRIRQQTAPFVKRIHSGPGLLKGRTILVRDPAKLGYTEIERTNAWEDDNGRAAYILICERLNHPAKRTTITAL